MSDQSGNDSSQKMNVIQNGHYVIIQRTHDRSSSRLIKAETDKFVYLGKQRLNLNGIFGHEYGSTFELDKKHELKLVNSEQIKDLNSILISDDCQDEKDNRFVVDDGKSQKLSKDEIETFKSELSSSEIIENLVKNSTTFKDKTVFAQQKYLKKKQQKYSTFVNVLKPNVRILAQMYYSQGPQKLNYLRIDTLAQMLSLCNVMSGCKYIVVDTHLGILTAAVLERLGSSGSVIQVYTDPGPVTSYRQAVDALNFSKDHLENMLFGIQINQIYLLANKSQEDAEKDSTENSGTFSDERSIRKEIRRIEAMKAKNVLKDKNLDGLLMIVKQHEPLNIIQLLFDYLSLSRPFAIYSPTIEPLISCFTNLKKKTVYLRITETWMRKFQVLENRTRPEMTMTANGGYLLTGIKVEPFDNV